MTDTEKQAQTDKVVAMLNEAFSQDPAAIHTLCCNRIPCNTALADSAHVVVDQNTAVGGYVVGTLGIVNGCLGALGLPLVAMIWKAVPEDPGSCDNSWPKFNGFVPYKPPQPTQEPADVPV